MGIPIVVEVTNENAREILLRKQNGENICPKCLKHAYKKLISKVFKTTNQETP
jgi:hypothetical protein